MTVNNIIDAICITINNVFGDDYTIYTESIKQGFEEPCFFIHNFSSANNLFLGNRYFRESQFCINYFPSDPNGKNTECHGVAERLYGCLDWLDVGDNLLRGIGLKHDILDGVLNFYVNYNSFEYKLKSTTPMGEIIKNLRVRE